MQDKVVTKRLFVGGISSNVTSEELQERFSRFGKISNLSLKRRTDDEGNPVKSFAHLDVEGDENNIRKCFNTYQHTKWKGSVLQLQYAKESFLSKLAKEREEEAKIKTEPASNNSTVPETKQSVTTPVVTEVKGVPGTPVPGKNDWVVGKYGRALPVLKLKKSYKIKMVKHDPSKFCHTAKVFKDNKDSLSDATCEKLTWEINTPDSEMTKKRKGNFPKSQGETEKDKKTSVVLEKGLHAGDDAMDTEKTFLNSVKVESNESEDLEIVKLGTGLSKKVSSSKNDSNRFDSDIESDSRPENANENNIKKKGKGKAKLAKISSSTELSKTEKENVLTGGLSTKSKSETQRSKGIVKTAMQSSIHSDKKIPAFKGLQMLSPSANFSKGSQETTVVSNIAAKRLQSDSSLLETGRTHKTDTFDRKADDNKSAQRNKNTSAKSSVEHKQVTESEGNKFTANISVNTAKKKVSPKDNDRHSTTKCPIPAFSGLEMLIGKGISAVQSEASKSATDSLETNFSVQGPKAGKIKETTKMDEKRTERTAKAQSSSSSFNLDLNNKEKHKAEDYDSSCSTDTYELLTRYKQKKGLMSACPTSLTFRQKLKLPEEYLHDVSPHRVVDISIIDQNLSISEYIAGISEFAEKPERMSSGVQQDPYDSDLDSNDFALVARKLAQKAAASGKKAAEKHVPRDGQRQNSLKTTANKISDLVAVEKKVDPQTNETKSALQSRLLDIANNKDGSDSLSEKASGQKLGPRKERSPINLSQSWTLNLTHSETKQATDNEKRLQVVKEKLKQKQQQQSLMQKALQNVDTSSSKRVVFDSGDSDENRDDSGSNIATKTHSNKSSKKEDQSKLALFDSSSDEEDQEDNNYDKLFESKVHFEGKKGEKLMKLDRKIGDSRFKLDARFVESDSEEDVETQTEVMGKEDDPQKVLEEEKAASLKVLENVIGKTTLDRFSEKLKKNTKHIIDMNAVRFDPTKISSQQSQSFQEEKKLAKDKNVFPERSSSPDVSTRKERGKVNQTQEMETVPGQIRKQTENQISHLGKKRTTKVLAEETEQEAKKKKKTERMTQEQKQETIQEAAIEVTAPKKPKKEKPASKMLESSTSIDVSTSNASSKVQLAPSLIDWFKKKAKDDDQEKETAQSFSLLKQFDQDTDDQNNRMDEDDDLSEEADTKAAPNSKVPLSGLFSKAASVTGRLMDGEKTGPTSGVESSADSSSEDNSEEESETESQPENSVRNVVNDNEDGGKEEEQDEPQIDPDKDLHKDLKNAGRVDVRFTKEQWLQRWEEIRPALIKTYKRKHKEALKSKRAQSEMKRRKAFLRNSKKGHWVRRKR